MSDPVSMLADEIEAELYAALLDAIENMGSIDVQSLTAAADRADEDDVPAYVADRLRPIQAILARAYLEAGALAADRLGLAFNDAEPMAVASCAEAVAVIMRPLIADTAGAMLQAGFRSSLLRTSAVTADKAAQVRDAIGLSPAQGASLAVFRAALSNLMAQQAAPVAQVGFTREPSAPRELPEYVLRHLSAPQRSVIEKVSVLSLDRAKVDELVAQQRVALLKVRASAVATSGALTITNAGEHASWRQAVERRDLGPQWRRVWRDVGDERVRHAHREVKLMNPNGVGIDEPFATPLGPCFHPPLEIACRCRVELKEVA